jgi:hypothetical protein
MFKKIAILVLILPNLCVWFLEVDNEHHLEQGSQARGPRAACGPPDAFVRPVIISKIDNIINFEKKLAYFKSFSVRVHVS